MGESPCGAFLDQKHATFGPIHGGTPIRIIESSWIMTYLWKEHETLVTTGDHGIRNHELEHRVLQWRLEQPPLIHLATGWKSTESRTDLTVTRQRSGFSMVFYNFIWFFYDVLWKSSIRTIFGNGKTLQTSFHSSMGIFHWRVSPT